MHIYIYIYICNDPLGTYIYMSNRPFDQVVECSPMARETRFQSLVIIPKNQQMVLDTSLLNTQVYKVLFKGEMDQSRERRSTLPYTSV